MLADGTYDNGLITFPQTEKMNMLDTYCRTEGVDYQHLLSQISRRQIPFPRFSFLGKKSTKNKSDITQSAGKN